MLTRSANQSLSEQLAARFAARIRDRLLSPGARLPSVRQCAQQQGVSPSTVVSAYDLLLAQGLLESRPQRGFFVRDIRSKVLLAQSGKASIAIENESPVLGIPHPGRMATPINATALIRGMFQPDGDRLQPGMGVFPPDWLVGGFMASAVRKVTGSAQFQTASLRYGEPQGDSGFRAALTRRLEGVGLLVQPGQLITTVGATHALDVVSRTLLKPGDSVMVEEPGWAVEFARLAALGMRILPVPRGPAGPDLDVMARLCEAHAPRLFVSVSVLHNPTGYCLTPGHAHRVLQLAQQFDFHVVEDDTYCHIAPEHATRMSVLDGLQRTLYVSGFAKILAPNWRVGFIAAPPALVDRLVDTKLLTTLTTPSLMEKALAHCMEQGQLRRHAERIRVRLNGARQRSVRQAQQAGCTFVAEPAGLFGWVDTGIDTDWLAQRMLDEGYLLAPGSLFHADRRAGSLMRVNFATTQEPAFWEAMQRCRAERGGV
jgi:DNA-binding transcriptional MocR family regulator